LARDGVAIALLGLSGEGKSTLAGELISRGWRLLSDDVLPFRIAQACAHIRAGAAQLKLSKSAAARLTDACGCTGRLDPNMGKWIFRFDSPRREYPLAAMFQLNRWRHGPLRLSRFDSVRAGLVIQGSYYNDALRPKRVLERQFDAAFDLARRVPVWKLRYPTGYTRISKTAEAIEKTVGL
jgi:hypothetical protein